MSYSNSRGGPGLRYPQASQYEPRGLVARAGNAAYSYVHDSKDQAGAGFGRVRYPTLSWQKAKSLLRASFCVANFLAVLWMFTLWWGERTVFRDQISQCYWDSWEKLVGTACLTMLEKMEADMCCSPPTQHPIMSFS
jgi:hypothetical protein